MSGTARLNMPLLSAGQAQKEFFHNEALQVVDLLVCACVEEGPLSTPPVSPAEGACYIVGPSPTGDWTGKEQQLAGFTSGGWRFITPLDGFSCYVKSASMNACFRGGSWEFGIVRGSSLVVDGSQVVGNRLGPIPTPTNGSNVDPEARSAIDDILVALRAHGLIES